MEGLEKEMLKMLLKSGEGESTRSKARKIPNAANLVQYPEVFNNSVPEISARPMEMSPTATVIIATQSQGYTEESFKTDVRETVNFFGLPRGLYEEILLKPVAEDIEILDSADAVKQMQQVVRKMNKATVKEVKTTTYSESAPLDNGDTRHGSFVKEDIVTTAATYTLRIVSLGVATSNFIFKALEYLLNHWRVPLKSVQFVTNGETEDHKFTDFWTTACINELVQQVQFVNISRYLPFGHYRGKGAKLLKTGHLHSRTTDNEPQVSIQNADSLPIAA